LRAEAEYAGRADLAGLLLRHNLGQLTRNQADGVDARGVPATVGWHQPGRVLAASRYDWLRLTRDDIHIVLRAREILSSQAKWNRADNRKCPASATTYSLYCALEQATKEISGTFEHRGAVMQQARFVIDEDLAKGNHYDHRLMDYNNDPKTTFADVQTFFALLEKRIDKRLDAQERH
jgi:hypothetical protein